MAWRFESTLSQEAKRIGVIGKHNQSIEVAASAAPEDGKANAAVRPLLADQLGIPRRHVELIRGATSPSRNSSVAGVSADHVCQWLPLPTLYRFAPRDDREPGIRVAKVRTTIYRRLR